MKKQIKIYTSFEDQQAAERSHSLSLTPEQRVAGTVALIKRVYNYAGTTKKERRIKIVSN